MFAVNLSIKHLHKNVSPNSLLKILSHSYVTEKKIMIEKGELKQDSFTPLRLWLHCGQLFSYKYIYRQQLLRSFSPPAEEE